MATILLFIVILGVLVIVHEWGHFFAARKFGMRVHEFGFGFPPRAFGVYKDPKTKKWKLVKRSKKSNLSNIVGGEAHEAEFPATLYSFNWLPLGGFVKIKGENGEDVNEGDSFGFHKPWKRLTVLLAGVFMNVFLAGVLLSIGLLIGLPADFSYGVPEGAIVVEPARVVVQQVQKGSSADDAGFMFGDKIFAFDGIRAEGSEMLTAYVREHDGQNIVFNIERAGEAMDIAAAPRAAENGNAQIGVLLADAGIIRYHWHIALYRGFIAAGIGLINIFITFWILIREWISGNGLIFDVSGPVGIAVVVSQSIRLGFNYLLNVVAMISLSLAAINVLPIPALDGGRAFFVVLEKIFRRPLPMKYEQLAHTVGFLFLMLLVIVVTYRDVVGLL